MKITAYLIAILALVNFACEDKISMTPITFDNPVTLSAPEDGQKSLFKQYSSTCGDLDGSFAYTKQTLVLEVVEDNGSFRFRETNGDGSFIAEYPVSVENNQLIIPERWNSSLFFFYGSDVIYLKPLGQVPLAQNGCRLMIQDEVFIGNEIGTVNRMNIGPISQFQKTAVSCVPWDMREEEQIEAYLVYDQDELLISHTLRNDNDVTGWVLAQ